MMTNIFCSLLEILKEHFCQIEMQYLIKILKKIEDNFMIFLKYIWLFPEPGLFLDVCMARSVLLFTLCSKIIPSNSVFVII